MTPALRLTLENKEYMTATQIAWNETDQEHFRVYRCADRVNTDGDCGMGDSGKGQE